MAPSGCGLGSSDFRLRYSWERGGGGQVVLAVMVVVVRGDMNQLVVSKGKRTGKARIEEVEKPVMLGFRLVSRDIFRVRV